MCDELSLKGAYQLFATIFRGECKNELKLNKLNYGCEVYMELDWVVNDNNVARPDCMVIWREFKDIFLIFPPQLILEVSFHFTRLRDRNTKSDLYGMYGVKYFIIADCDKKTTEIFELVNNKYK